MNQAVSVACVALFWIEDGHVQCAAVCIIPYSTHRCGSVYGMPVSHKECLQYIEEESGEGEDRPDARLRIGHSALALSDALL